MPRSSSSNTGRSGGCRRAMTSTFSEAHRPGAIMSTRGVCFPAVLPDSGTRRPLRSRMAWKRRFCGGASAMGSWVFSLAITTNSGGSAPWVRAIHREDEWKRWRNRASAAPNSAGRSSQRLKAMDASQSRERSSVLRGRSCSGVSSETPSVTETVCPCQEQVGAAAGLGASALFGASARAKTKQEAPTASSSPISSTFRFASIPLSSAGLRPPRSSKWSAPPSTTIRHCLRETSGSDRAISHSAARPKRRPLGPIRQDNPFSGPRTATICALCRFIRFPFFIFYYGRCPQQQLNLKCIFR
ncbi:MAG: hypothetical protein BWY09_01512 [Candidatus Hydrogenedentes bacterium ADurb.Bin179]|nr:MAG: hypothetical protein BWY09_01512 [Candidatus Hydrogenedentes bacterium ADurb.Bin179]